MNIKNFPYLKLIFIFSMTSLSVISSGQDQESWAERLNNLNSMLDPNNKRFELLALSKDLMQQGIPNEKLNELEKYTDQVQVVKSDDDMITVVAFGAPTYKGVYQLEWIIHHDNQSWAFSEEYNSTFSSGAKDLTFTFNKTEDDLYSLKVTTGKQTLVDACDLISKCLFEQLQTLSSDQEKEDLNALLLKRLNNLWSDEAYFSKAFTGLKRMKTLHSEDGKVKICTYNLQKEGFNQFFCGAVITKDDEVSVHMLTDTSEKIRSPERSSLTNKKWYGALYVDLIQTSGGGKTYYTLIGYKGHDEFVKTRVLDVLLIQNGRLRFGMPIFKTDRVSRNRVVFQYSSKATMMLRYDAREKLIVYDNLAPADPMYRGVYHYYGPDFSYNAFKFTKGVWENRKDIDLRNPKSE
ncbi:hypothetical protein [Carboxylicivirga sp. M1479]|uniref:hypothetical protein n=1 Tax=Carboxylicivirga sp. M1479 TaxID=2594476 RepID=UPI0011784ADC|nr:hypothetical protein [Carboxylicivirga sp. M1479]TRX70305.1 hypothetical protein FNN09_12545 [Carboxylicivirga sp. M1479]